MYCELVNEVYVTYKVTKEHLLVYVTYKGALTDACDL